MNLNARRPTGTHITHTDKQNKSDVVWMLKENGYTLEIRKHAGEWNTYRTFFAVNGVTQIAYSLHVGKGERVDWDEMYHEFERGIFA